ncbi:hypothetical protein RND71_039040 [Anisodus tanguticus]|uniref:RING-type domain-containing protein n=1 Tax=Anisodus tanguticus TaxID=243964 RepID=A0AAE1UX96_9SOLA|nr:hypothetical protein RND71_039040 [Anisodus tanguticus]
MMNGGDRVIRRRKSLTERLGLKGIGCCGPTWGILPATTLNVVDDDENNDVEVMNHHIHTSPEIPSATCLAVEGSSSSSRMNLATALAAERHFRAESDDTEVSGLGLDSNSNPLRPDSDCPGRTVPGTPTRMSLMRLLEETEVYEGELLMEKEDEGVVGSDCVCCVCMRRKKGAAFIPCGHTFCRVCSRELWVNRGNCPLCNRSILEILDIY